MQIYLGGTNVTQLVTDVSTTGSRKECARTLRASIVQSPADNNLPVVKVSNGMPVAMQADGQYFAGMVFSYSSSTASNKIDFIAKDHGIFIKRNKITYKVKKLTAEAAAADICAEYGMPVGNLAPTGFVFSRNFMGVSMYDAIMTGYALAAAENEKKYQLLMEGTSVSIIERGSYIAAAIAEGENLIEASYSESIENMVNQVDIYGKDGKLKQPVTGDTSYGIMRDQVVLTNKEDGVAKAEQMIRDHGMTRSGSVRNIGNAACVAGAAVMIRESFTGLWGKFCIESDTHNWKSGTYTNTLTLAWENTMDAKAAGAELKKGKSRPKGTAQFVDPEGNPYVWD
ncbi:MAG TPA: hypothetical protein PKX46_00035 [Clostridia bacterium]|nr:hypothetical protein [Clostridia bacterium]